MNLQKELSGQISGMVPNQIGTSLSGLSHGNPMHGQMQNPNFMHVNVANTERRYMQQKIFELMSQKRQQANEIPPNRMIDLVARLEAVLFEIAGSTEEYFDLSTLETRLQVAIKRLAFNNNRSQQFQHANSSPAIGTMIPAPGFQPPGSSSMTGSLPFDSSLATSHGSNTILPGRTLPFDSSLVTNHGSNTIASVSFLPAGSGYQQSSFPATVGGNHMTGSVGVERMTCQMIPTPGFSNSNDANNKSNNQLLMNMDVSQPMRQKQQVDGQNSRIFHNMGENRSTLQHNPSGLPNAPFNGGFGKTGNIQQVNCPGITDGYLTGAMYKNSLQSSNQQFVHRPAMQDIATRPQGDVYGKKITAGSMPKINSTTTAYQSAVDSTQLVTALGPQVTYQSDKMSTQSQFSGRENLVQPHNQSLDKLEALQNQQMENQLLLNDGMFRQAVSGTKFTPGTEYNVHGFQSQVSETCQLSQMHYSNDDHLRYTHASDQMQQMLQLHGQTYSNSQDIPRRNPLDQTMQDELHHRLSGQDAAKLNNLSSEEAVMGQMRYAGSSMQDAVIRRCRNINRDKQFKNQQKWLLFLRHARRCPYLAGKCPEPNCLYAQNLVKHIDSCQETQCSYPRCHWTKLLLHHNRNCEAANCPVCAPVKSYVQKQQLKAPACSDCNSGLPEFVNGSFKSNSTTETAGRSTPMTGPLVTETAEDLHPNKRIKIEQVSGALVSAFNKPLPLNAQHDEQHHESHYQKNSETSNFKMEVPESIGQSAKFFKSEKNNLDNHDLSENTSGFAVIKEEEMGQDKQQSTLQPSEGASNAGKPKVKGVSMMELFTPEQVRQHIASLRQWVGQSKAKAERNQAMGHSMSENSCQLCAVERLTYEPLPLYCSPCGARIKRNAMYYTTGALETRHYFCVSCCNNARGDTMVFDSIAIPKAKMEKKKNDEDTEESWVLCDKCEVWQHQVCALFNPRRNDCGQADYTCPNCYIAEVERGERVPLPLNSVLGAEDLPKTILSDHLEQRLFAKLKQERHERANKQGKSYDEVPGAESLVVRVVSSVDKTLEVKPQFYEIFKEENFPKEFPYKSKVVLLFQKIEGIEVCLFGMYLQEFGSECQQPNHRRVYLSYLDSVKYFRPDVKTVTGEALRTFVYHEILIGYLEYCKQRGFASCYIWACPPLKGEDYILYCHPEIQKTPKSDKLREWYLSMLRKAMNESIVAELTNMYDHFFVSNGECKAKVTASRLPYFDGDYWPGAAEDIIVQLQQGDDGKRPYNKKGGMRKTVTKRALMASGHTDLSDKAAKDLMLMRKLGDTISPMKEDFIMVHFYHACAHCCILMVSGRSWVCKQCRNFRLCDKCHEAERVLDDRERHPISQKDKHPLYPVEISGVPDDTKDKDEILESEHFDTRQAFLSLCQGNHYQYDTLRRAKHSSMMVLYHLHNPSAPSFVVTCEKCHLELENGQGWRCEVCPEFDVCNACYHNDGGINHPHRLYSSSDRDAQNTEARALRVSQLKKMLELLVHASKCPIRAQDCPYPNCLKVKGLFRHGMNCRVRASGGCPLCKKMWNLLNLHARTCKASLNKCTVPRCRDLQEYTRRVQSQAETRRRAAVNEMMRQRAAQVYIDS